MISFENDYIYGAHEAVLRRLYETNMEPLSGYGVDKYCEAAAEKIREACACPDAQVRFLVGGTQTNQIVIASMLRPYEGVVSAATGHIGTHEAGAVEYTGHKVLEIGQHQGRIDAGELERYLDTFFSDGNNEHMVRPGMVYISHPTEYGTLYSLKELTEISAICRRFSIPLYMDGARLACALMSYETDVTLQDIARLCDIFYIGGTKMGALCGEALVFTKNNMPPHFTSLIKQHGGLLAKGRVLGVQFDALFTDDLYCRLGRHAIDMAERLKAVFEEKGCEFYMKSPTNQQFVILASDQLDRLQGKVACSFWERLPDGRSVVRFVTSWGTTTEDIEALKALL